MLLLKAVVYTVVFPTTVSCMHLAETSSSLAPTVAEGSALCTHYTRSDAVYIIHVVSYYEVVCRHRPPKAPPPHSMSHGRGLGTFTTFYWHA